MARDAREGREEPRRPLYRGPRVGLLTTTYDPHDPAYLEEADLRRELTRVYDLCHGCRLCFKFCTAFPSLFEMIDEHDDQDAARLTPDQQDRVVSECFGCKLCYVNCPYIPGQSEWAIDFPRLMMRATQVRHQEGGLGLSNWVTDQALGRTDTVGKLNVAAAPVVNRALGTPGSAARRLMSRVTGVASERVLPPYARQRFSTWFRRRSRSADDEVGVAGADDKADDQGRVALFSTCLVEYQDPAIGKALVGVYERNRVSCSLPAGQVCCGAPWLHQGDVERFRHQAEKNIEVLAGAVREGCEVVVPQPTCGYVLKFDYPDYVGGPDAALVAEHTHDAAEYLVGLHRDEGTTLDTTFEGEVPDSVTYHAPCHLRAQNIGYRSRDLLKLTGTEVTVVAECSGIDGSWGYREENYEISRRVAAKMGEAISKADDEVVAGDCHLANGGIVQETGRHPVHPLQVLASAYGLPADG